jgi:hypothetical protein|tara:strand:+ start:92 stop:247 length:156 start_codon:yes stop_codon:yes gene_type:complete
MATEKPKVVDAPPIDDSIPKDTEKALADFFKNTVLTDITLRNPNTGQDITK